MHHRRYYSRPFFIAPHTLRRFRTRFGAHYSDSEIQALLNEQLQPPRLPDAVHINMKRGDPALYYGLVIDRLEATAVVTAPPNTNLIIKRKPNQWPVIVTVYPGRKHITRFQKKLTEIRSRQKRHAKREQWEIESVRLLRWIGYSPAEIGEVLQIARKKGHLHANAHAVDL